MNVEKLQETTRKLAATFEQAAALADNTGRAAHAELLRLLDDAGAILAAPSWTSLSSWTRIRT